MKQILNKYLKPFSKVYATRRCFWVGSDLKYNMFWIDRSVIGLQGKLHTFRWFTYLNLNLSNHLRVSPSFQVLVFAVIVAFLLLISSSLIADNAEEWKGWGFWLGSNLDKLRAAAVSCILAFNTTPIRGLRHRIEVEGQCIYFLFQYPHKPWCPSYRFCLEDLAEESWE